MAPDNEKQNKKGGKHAIHFHGFDCCIKKVIYAIKKTKKEKRNNEMERKEKKNMQIQIFAKITLYRVSWT